MLSRSVDESLHHYSHHIQSACHARPHPHLEGIVGTAHHPVQVIETLEIGLIDQTAHQAQGIEIDRLTEIEGADGEAEAEADRQDQAPAGQVRGQEPGMGTGGSGMTIEIYLSVGMTGTAGM